MDDEGEQESLLIHSSGGGERNEDTSNTGSSSRRRITRFYDVFAETDAEAVGPIAADVYTSSLTKEEQAQQVRETIRSGSLLILGIVALGVALIYLRFILIPLVFSRGLVYIFQPLINLLVGKKAWPPCNRRLRLPRWLAVLVCCLLMLAVLFVLGLIIFFTVQQIVDNSDKYKDELQDWADKISDFFHRWGFSLNDIIDSQQKGEIGSYALKVVRTLFDVIPQVVLVLIFMLYMLIDYDEKKEKTALQHAIDVQIRQYIIIHTIVSVVEGVATSLILLALSNDLYLIFGLATFILNYIPNIGSVIAVILPTLFAVIDPDEGPLRILLTFVLLSFLHFVVGQVLEPRILGNAMHIPAITVLVALMFWGYIWGIVGAIISVPITSSIYLFLNNIDHPMPKFLAGLIVGDFTMFWESDLHKPVPPPPPRASMVAVEKTV